MRKTIPICILLAAGLSGCAQPPLPRAITSDQVMAVQYRAASSHGAMSGDEATRITDGYRSGLAATPEKNAQPDPFEQRLRNEQPQ